MIACERYLGAVVAWWLENWASDLVADLILRLDRSQLKC